MDVGSVIGNYKWIKDVNLDGAPQRSEVAAEDRGVFDLPLTDAECTAAGIPLTEKYVIENLKELLTLINTKGKAVSDTFRQGYDFFKGKNYIQAKPLFDQAVKEYAELVELYAVLVQVTERNFGDSLAKDIKVYKDNYQIMKDNLALAMKNSGAAANNIKADELDRIYNGYVDQYQVMVGKYNSAVNSYNKELYQEALDGLLVIEKETSALLAKLQTFNQENPSRDVAPALKAIGDFLVKAQDLMQKTTQALAGQ